MENFTVRRANIVRIYKKIKIRVCFFINYYAKLWNGARVTSKVEVLVDRQLINIIVRKMTPSQTVRVVIHTVREKAANLH